MACVAAEIVYPGLLKFLLQLNQSRDFLKFVHIHEIVTYLIVHILDVKLDCTHPVWSSPPLMKKSTCPTGIEIPNSVKYN